MVKPKHYTVKPTKTQLKILKHYWERMVGEHNYFLQYVSNLEEEMSMKTGIKGLEFFLSDGYYAGIGNIDRTMPLIQEDKLRRKK